MKCLTEMREISCPTLNTFGQKNTAKFIWFRAERMMVQILGITLLTPCRTVPFDNLIAAYLFKKFEVFYETQRFTWSFQLLLSWAKWIKPTAFPRIYLRYVSTPSSNLSEWSFFVHYFLIIKHNVSLSWVCICSTLTNIFKHILFSPKIRLII